jgi:hypothetical protein
MGYHVYDKDGNLVGYLEDEDDIERYLDSLPDDLHVFDVGGFSEDVDRFMVRVNSPEPTGESFIDKLDQRYGRVPVKINPFKEVKDIVFGNNAFFIKLRNFVDMQLVSQMLSVLRDTLPAGATFFVILEMSGISEEAKFEFSENIELFHVPDIAESYDGMDEAVVLSTVVV